MEFAIFILFVFVPPFVALWKGVRKITRFQFGLPELIMLPLAATPTILVAIYTKILACILVGIYQASFGFLIWSHGRRENWFPAVNIVRGVMVGTVVLAVWVALVAALVGAISSLFNYCQLPLPRK